MLQADIIRLKGACSPQASLFCSLPPSVLFSRNSFLFPGASASADIDNPRIPCQKMENFSASPRLRREKDTPEDTKENIGDH